MPSQSQLAWITGANWLIGNYLVQTAPRFAPRWRVQIPFGKAGIQA
jgi:hypothetical protein